MARNGIYLDGPLMYEAGGEVFPATRYPDACKALTYGEPTND